MPTPSTQHISAWQRIRSSLRWRLWLLLFCTICAILFAFTILISHLTQAHSRRTLIATSENLVYQGAENLENYFHNIETALLVPYSNSALYQRISSSSAPVYEVDSYVSLALKAIASADPTIYQTHLYVDSQATSYLVQSSVFSKSVRSKAPVRGAISLEALHESRSYVVSSISPKQSRPVISMHRTLMRVPEDTYIGQIDIDLEPSYLNSVMEKLKTDDKESVFLLHTDGTLIYAPDGQASLPAQARALLPKRACTGSATRKTGHQISELFFYSGLQLKCGEFLLLKVTPASILTAGASQLIRLSWFIALLALLVSSAILFAISARFTAPIAQLAQHMERIGQGDMQEAITTDRTDEIGSLIIHFQAMMDNINELIRQKYALELSNKNSQLLALQAQLNPHFINNTIQSIGACALQAGNREIYEQLAFFGSMMQYCMDFDTSAVPLEQEITFTQNYLYFQKLRFSGRFVYSIQAADALLSVYVPKMLLQPLVENAFVHGRLQDRTNGFLLLRVTPDGPFCTITVEDNGAGASEQVLQRLRAELDGTADSTSSSGHIGICNSYARLQLYYGNAASISVYNRARGGFILKLRLPISREDPS